jgi:serine protease Do
MGKRKVQFWKIFLSVLVTLTIISWVGAASSYAADSQADVPKVVERTTPSVVAIIGKPSGSDKSLEKNRYNLAHGTGVIVKSDGVIITNAHVVKDMNNIVVVTSEGKSYSGHTTNIDEESDLALVKIEATGLPTATFASSADIKVGETVAAIGTPISFALRNSVTVGIVSGIDRSLSSEYQLIQTDAAINPGNSGGALINMNGEVIGINTMKYAELGVENLGFAIPVDTVKYVLDNFERYGKVKRPYLGVELEESWEAVVGLPSSQGLRVAYVDLDSPAAKAGVKQDDGLVSIGGHNVKTLVDYNEALKKYLPGETVDLSLQSGGTTVTKQITFGEVQSKEIQQSKDAGSSNLDTDQGKTRIGDSHFGWSMKYPSGLVKAQQSADGNAVTFADAKGQFYLMVHVDANQREELSPSGLLNMLTGSDESDTILERQYVKSDSQPYAKIVAKSEDRGYGQARAYQQNGRIYTVTLFIGKEAGTANEFKQNSLIDLLDSFQLSFDAKDQTLKDISEYSDHGNTYTNGYGLSLDLPMDWKDNSASNSSSFYSKDYEQNITVHVTSASSGDTLKAWVERENKQFSDTYASDYREIGSPEEMTIAGISAIQNSYASSLGDKWNKRFSIFLIKDKYKYEIDYTYPKEADADEVSTVMKNITSSISINKDLMDSQLGFIQDIDELTDSSKTVKYTNEKYKFAMQVPESWTGNPYDGEEKDQEDTYFHFTGGSLTVTADTTESYEDAVKKEDSYHKKNADADSEYKYTATDTTLFQVSGKKYEVHYTKSKIPYTETTYMFRKNNLTYNVTLSIDEAVRTSDNEARLNKAFESLTFQSK